MFIDDSLTRFASWSSAWKLRKRNLVVEESRNQDDSGVDRRHEAFGSTQTACRCTQVATAKHATRWELTHRVKLVGLV